jgi:hypothetical protein
VDVPGLSGRRRATLAVLGGAAAVVLVLGAVWLASGDGERDAAPGPAGASPTPTEAPTVSPSAPDPAGGTIPDDFPLDLDQEAMEGDGGEMLGPSAEAPGLRDLTLCGTSIWTVEPLERLASTATGPEYADSRELRVYPTADDAAKQVADVRSLVAGCPEEQVDGGGILVHAPIDADTGYDSVTWGDTYTEGLGGGPVQVVRVGRAVLAVARGGEFAPETLPAGVAEVTDRTAAIAPAMCAFTETGCGVSGSHGAGSGEWTIGPEGIGPVRARDEARRRRGGGRAVWRRRRGEALRPLQLAP